MVTPVHPIQTEALLRLLAEHSVACPACGYSLRGLRDLRCPECGLVITEEALEVRRRRPATRGERASSAIWWTVLACLLGVWLLALYVVNNPRDGWDGIGAIVGVVYATVLGMPILIGLTLTNEYRGGWWRSAPNLVMCGLGIGFALLCGRFFVALLVGV